MSIITSTTKPPHQTKVAVALSGGVDSSVVALLLKQQGYDVTGIHLKQWTNADDPDKLEVDTGRAKPATCCTLEDQLNVVKLGKQLDIPIQILNYRDFFKRTVVDYFLDEYGSLRTPNPCVVCNRTVRFGAFLQAVLNQGFDYLATGHYVRNIPFNDGKNKTEYQLLKGTDNNKDQSYFLYTLTQDKLEHILFPLGEMTKPEVRRLAAEANLPTAAARESQEVSFIVGDYREFLKKEIPLKIKDGEVVTVEGAVIGQHKGLPLYTIGQRKGLQTKLNVPLYVKDMEPETNRLVVGSDEQTKRTDCQLKELTWVSGHPPTTTDLSLRIRHGAPQVTATLTGDHLVFDHPQKAVSPGQSVVFYDGDICLGGGVIV